MLLLKIWFGNVSDVFEVKVPELVLTSRVNLNTQEGMGEIVLDWSGYDIYNKYFVIYRKQKGSQDFEKIVNLEDKFNGNSYVDSFGNDKASPYAPNISITGNESQNNLQINVNSNDTGSSYTYYVESYDSNNLELLSVSN